MLLLTELSGNSSFITDLHITFTNQEPLFIYDNIHENKNPRN